MQVSCPALLYLASGESIFLADPISFKDDFDELDAILMLCRATTNF
jgi:hypothetical protein